MAMLEGVEPLTLHALNDATLAWVEREYQRAEHGELGCAPLTRAMAGPDVSRACPDATALRHAFRADITRKQRRSDGTCTVAGVRFEVPARFRHLHTLRLRHARWDTTCIDLVDPHTGDAVAALYPLDKQRNAEFARRALTPIAGAERDAAPLAERTRATAMAPLLKRLMAEYAATGLPPAYIAFDDTDPEDPDP